jgi:hypothetical protein
MKRQTIAILFIFFMGTALSGYSQSVVAQRQAISEKLVPKIILDTFKKQYPNILLGGWYGQPTAVVYTCQKPIYYEVEFMDNPSEPSRALYNIHGRWHET